MSDDSSNCAGSTLIAFAVGALLGAGVALLYAPRSGKETREILADKSRELRDKARDARDDAKSYFAGKKAEIEAAVEAGKEAIRQERARAKTEA